MIKYGNIALTTTITLLTLYHLCLLLLVRLGGYIVNLSDFYSYRLIGKLTAFLQLQEFSQRNQTWGHRTSTLAARFLLFAEIEVWQHPRQGVSFACEPKLRWGAYRL